MAVTTTTSSTSSRLTPERTAWGVLLLSFAMFCTLCIASSVGVYLFLFESTTSMNVQLRVGRGTVGVTESDLIPRAELQGRDLTGKSASISTDPQSQATVSFLSPADNRLIAVVTLKRNTSTELLNASSPRFEWSNRLFELRLAEFVGTMDILVIGDQANEFFFQIKTINGALIDINRNGRYSVTATENEVRATSSEGTLVVYSPNLDDNRIVPSGQSITLMTDASKTVVSPMMDNLIENGLFVLLSTETDTAGEPVPFPHWGCNDTTDATDPQSALPRGTFQVENFDGRSVMRLLRSGGARSQRKTGCLQPISNDKRDVSGYDFLELTVTFFINYQSLDKCGTAGTECPLMLVMQYVDVQGETRLWYQGFYYADNPQLDYPLRIQGVSQEHQKVNEKVWYTFETGNLFTAFPEDARPARINSVEFYASGHEYDVLVSEFAIHAGNRASVTQGN